MPAGIGTPKEPDMPTTAPISGRPINGRPTNPIGLGCMSLSWAYGPRPADIDGIALLHRAIELGYDHFDTARLYGEGHNETLVGEALRGRRDKVFLASKMGIFASGERRGIDCRPETIREQLEVSLRLLQTDHIDLYYMHRRDFTVPIEESVAAMADLIKEGKMGAIGLSEMSADTLRRACAVHPIAAMQTEYSPWTRQAEIAVIDACRELGTTFVAFSPVGRGALANGVADPAAVQRDCYSRRGYARTTVTGLGAGQGRPYRGDPRHQEHRPSGGKHRPPRLGHSARAGGRNRRVDQPPHCRRPPLFGDDERHYRYRRFRRIL